MEKILLKKTLLIPQVTKLKEWGDSIDNSLPEIEKVIYWEFCIWELSIDLNPVWWRFFDSVEELNKALGTDHNAKYAVDYNDMIATKNRTFGNFMRNNL